MMTGREYIESLPALEPEVSFLGQKIRSTVDEPKFQPHLYGAVMTYGLAHHPEYEEIMTAGFHLRLARVNRFPHGHYNIDSLNKKVRSMALNHQENNIHENCFACGSNNGTGLRLRFCGKDDDSVVGHFNADPQFEGYPGIIQGGIIATLLDSAMSHCLFLKGHYGSNGKNIDSIFLSHPGWNDCQIGSQDKEKDA